jgi:hypothetical protein
MHGVHILQIGISSKFQFWRISSFSRDYLRLCTYDGYKSDSFVGENVSPGSARRRNHRY